MQLIEPYTIAYETIDSCENVFLKISTDEGITGMGCAAPDMAVTKENADTVVESVNKTIEPYLKGKDAFQYARIMDTLKLVLPEMPSSRAMVDSALYDIMAQKARVPLYKLLGGYRHSIPTSITIGIGSLEETLTTAGNFLRRGFRKFKIKGGLDVHSDIERVVKLRELLGKQAAIRFDANQGYSVDESVLFINKTRSVNVEILEQPTSRFQSDLLKQVTNKVEVPVMADESILSLKDAFRLTKNNCMDMINIKLMKTGGILEAMHINSVAKAAGKETMVGCMDESALGIAAGMHFALSRPNVRYADLDGHLDLLDDPFQGLVTIKNGVLYPSEAAGLGWTKLKNIGL